MTLGSAGGTACGKEGSRSRPRGRSADRRARALCGVLTGSSRPPACLSSIKLTRLSSRLLNPSPGGDRHGPDCLPKGWTKTSLSVSKRLGGRKRQRADRAARPLLPPSVAAQPCTRVAGTGLVTAAARAAGLWEMLFSISEVDRKLGAAEASAAPGFGGPRPSPGQGAAPAGSRRTPVRSVSRPATRGPIYGHRCGSACAQVVSRGDLLTDVPEEQSR